MRQRGVGEVVRGEVVVVGIVVVGSEMQSRLKDDRGE
mgnify:CR=1 FL=1